MRGRALLRCQEMKPQHTLRHEPGSKRDVSGYSTLGLPSERLPRISFGVMVLNGEPFTRYCLRSLYPFAYEIIVVEGGHEDARAVATADGHSTDSTLNSLHRFVREEDVAGKVRIVTREGFWPRIDELTLGQGSTRTSQSRAYAELATGDYLWQVDIDEFYMPEDMLRVLRMLSDDPSITAVTFPYRDFWARPDYLADSWKSRRKGVAHRLFKWEQGYTYQRHRPPTVIDDCGRDLRGLNWVSARDMARRGVWMYHYSHLFPSQVLQKASVYQEEWSEISYEAQKWAENYFRLRRPYRVERHYFVPSWLKRYRGAHPPQITRMMDDIESGSLSVELRPTDDVEKLLSSWWYPVGAALLGALEPIDRAWRYSKPRLVNLAYGRVPHRVRRVLSRFGEADGR
jgi:glycosyltransferase involved in cell wall biosynthesis